MNQLKRPLCLRNDAEQPQDVAATAFITRMVDDVAAVLRPQLRSRWENQVEQFLSDQQDGVLPERLSSLANQLIPQAFLSDFLVDSITKTIQGESTRHAGRFHSPCAVYQKLSVGAHMSAHTRPQGTAIAVAPRVCASNERPPGYIQPGEERLLRQRGRAVYTPD